MGTASAGTPDETAFREQYLRAAKLYAEKDYAAAIPALQAAYALQPAPQLLYNIGQAYRRLENWGTARVYFEMYRAVGRELSPSATADLERTLLELKEKEQAARQPEVVEKTRTLVIQEEKPPPRWLRPFGLVTGLSGLGLAAGGAVFLGLDSQCVSPATPPAVQCQQLFASKTLGAALTTAGAGLFVIGAITFGMSLRRPARPQRRIDDALPLDEPLILPLSRIDIEPPPQGWSSDGSPIEPPPAGWRQDGTRRSK